MSSIATYPPSGLRTMDSGRLTSSWVVPHARALVWLVNDLARQTHDSAGRKHSVSSENSCPPGWSGRIRPVWQVPQPALFSIPFKTQWPKWGIRWGADNGGLPTLERPTGESESSSLDGWATPAASWYERGQTSPEVWEKRQQARIERGEAPFATPLHIQVAQMWPTPRAYSFDESHTPGLTALDVRVRGLYPNKARYWPTPQAFDANDCNRGANATYRDRNRRKIGGNGGPSRNLREVIQTTWPTPTVNDAGNATAPPSQEQRKSPVLATCASWPTPRATDGEKGGVNQKHGDGSPCLANLAAHDGVDYRTWATPTQADGMGGPGSSGRDGGDNLRTQVSGGTLSPHWVASLQGLPDGWLGDTPVSQEARLAACVAPQWPARPGCAQHDWEAPRTLTERMKDRSKALRALGNACVSAQAYPLFKAIVDATNA